MKMQKAIKLLSKSGNIHILEGKGGLWWISDGFACYPVYDVPMPSPSDLAALYDIDAKKALIDIKLGDESPVYNVATEYNGEEICGEFIKLGVSVKDKGVTPIKTALDVEFIKTKYITPLEIEAESATIQRALKTGFAIYNGITLACIVMPVTGIITDEFLSDLWELYTMSKITYANQNKEETGENGRV